MKRAGYHAIMCMVLALGSHSEVNGSASKKIIGLVPVRNEAIMIEQCLRALACYTDAIIVLDDASTDNTLEIVSALKQECNIVKIIEKKVWQRCESDDRNLLLNVGRSCGGTHFLVIDADELFTANCMQDDTLRNAILALEPGDTLMLHWIRLWKSLDVFKASDVDIKRFAFCDDGIAAYPPRIIHNYRVPEKLTGTQHDFGQHATHGLLHFQAVNWRNMQIRQAWYQCLECIVKPHADRKRLSYLYNFTMKEEGLTLASSLPEWFTYDFFDPTVFYQDDTWREHQIESWIKQYGLDYFKDLAIWHIDWHFNIENNEN